MSKPQDGFVSRFLNRPISSRLTGLLVRFPIQPTAFTASIFVLPLVAAVFLQRGDYLNVVLGAVIFQVFSVLDGCDGEIARAKNLESKFGERLDSLCDFLGSLIYVLALGSGINRFKEGVVCALLITASELVLRWGPDAKRAASEDFHKSFYARHHGMIGHSGLLDLGERFVWWLFQLTKRDVAIFFFLLLALLNLSPWILHLWTFAAGTSLLIGAIATARAANSRRDTVSPSRTDDFGSESEMTSDLS
ncbi:MAG TPA: CDP-alcohol phosphatidyltransferase family protein [Chthoniobacterales bacterium]|nr:CDP-alcohol phosphatidyltransferase family protein [Chthoniobacterales bacterium]